MTVDEIAKERSFVASTIYSHLLRFISSGEIQPEELVGKERFTEIKNYLEAHGSYENITQLYTDADGKFTYNELRVGLMFLERMGKTEN